MQLEKVERNIFFKVSRNLTFLVGALAVVSLVISILILLYAISPTMEGSKPEPPVMSKEVSITPDAIKSELTKMAEKASETAISQKQAQAFPQTSQAKQTVKPGIKVPQQSEYQKLEEKVKEVKSLFPSNLYSWRNVYKSVCVSGAYGNCWQIQQKIVKYGISEKIGSVLRFYRFKEDQLSALDELKSLVSSYPEEQRGDVLTAWVNLRIAKEKARRKNFNKEERAYRAALETQRESYIASIERKAALKPTSLMILGISFALIWQVGLILAILGVERNTRLLEEFIKANAKQ